MKKLVSRIKPENEVTDLTISFDDKYTDFYKLVLNTSDGPLYTITLRKISKQDLIVLKNHITDILKD